MKYFIILIGFLILQSCVKEENLETPEESKVDLGYKYSKKVDVFDTEGNTAVVQISGNDYQYVNGLTANDLELKVTKKDFNQFNNSEGVEVVYYEEETPVTKDFSNYIFIDVIETDLKEDVTGVFVDVKTQPDIGTRGGKSWKYAYGFTGVRGAAVVFESEEQNNCKLEIDLDKLTTSNSHWYSEMADAKLKDPNDIFAHYETPEYYKYRLILDENGWGCGWIEYDWWWIY